MSAARAPLRVVGAALVDDLHRPTLLLAARRTGPPALAGGWELPGGKVERGEDPEQALHRELREELGIGVRLGAELRPAADDPVAPEHAPGWPEPASAGPPADPWPGSWPMPQLPGPGSLAQPGGRLRVWLASVTHGEPRALEDHDALRWLGRDAWLSVGWLAVDVPVVHHLERAARR